MLGTNVGGIYYDVSLDTAEFVRDSRRVGSQVEDLAGKFNVITRAVQLYAAALAALKLAEAADNFRLLQTRVNIAAESIEAGADAFERLRKISSDTRSSLEGNVQVFTRLNPAIRQMGGTASDTLRVVDLLSRAITVSGASAAEKTSAMIQFGQALGSGKLAGDELRSLLENAPYLMKQLADGLGVPIGQLKALGEQGKLTSDVVVNALGKAADKINRDFAQMPETVASAMQVARDELSRLVEAMDQASGSSALLTGVLKGAGQVFDMLATQIGSARQEGDTLGRSTAVQTWAQVTAKVLTYVVDAVDVTQRGFRQLGTVLGGIAAYGAQMAGGNFAQAGATLRSMGRDVMAIGSGATAGARMRQQMDALAGSIGSVGDARDALAARGAPGSKLTAPAATGDEKGKTAGKRAAAQAYYEGLLADAKTGLAKIDAEEAKALADNKKRMAEDPRNADIYGRARVAIAEKYARERALLEERYTQEAAAATIAITTDEAQRIALTRAEAYRSADREVALGVRTFEQGERAKVVAAFEAEQQLSALAERNARARFDAQLATTLDSETRIRLLQAETVRAAEEAYKRGRMTFEEAEAAKVRAAQQARQDMQALEGQRASARMDTLQLRAGSGGTEDRAALIRAQAEAQIQATLQAQQRDLANAALYAEQRVAIEEEMNRRLAELRANDAAQAFGALSGAFGQLTESLRTETGKQDALFRAAFVAQKAYAIASAIVNIQAGVARAANLPFPANLGAMATVLASTASIISTIRGANYGGGRQYGGPVAAGTMYRVNESGRPEMFTAANGAQYMLPTASGQVTSADRVPASREGAAAQPMTVVQNFSIAGAPADLRTQQQIATAAARGLQIALARNG